MVRPIYRFLHLVFALSALHMLVLIGSEAKRGWELHQQQQFLVTEVKTLEASTRRLQEEVKAATDPSYIERLVRRLGFVKKDEVLYPRP